MSAFHPHCISLVNGSKLNNIVVESFVIWMNTEKERESVPEMEGGRQENKKQTTMLFIVVYVAVLLLELDLFIFLFVSLQFVWS